MFHKKTLMTLAVLGLILTAGIGSTYAFSGSESRPDFKNLTDEQKQEMQARHEEAQAKHEDIAAAIELGDYDLWLETVGSDSPMAEQVTEEEFPTLVQAHGLMQEGKEKFEQARNIREDIGLKAGPNFMKRHKW